MKNLKSDCEQCFCYFVSPSFEITASFKTLILFSVYVFALNGKKSCEDQLNATIYKKVSISTRCQSLKMGEISLVYTASWLVFQSFNVLNICGMKI